MCNSAVSRFTDSSAGSRSPPRDPPARHQSGDTGEICGFVGWRGGQTAGPRRWRSGCRAGKLQQGRCLKVLCPGAGAGRVAVGGMGFSVKQSVASHVAAGYTGLHKWIGGSRSASGLGGFTGAFRFLETGKFSGPSFRSPRRRSRAHRYKKTSS